MSTGDKPIRGTWEWAVATVDCAMGCPHGCRYCYARYDAVTRKQLVTADEWDSCMVNTVPESFPLFPGQVMFPANHDIIPEILEPCLEVIQKLIDAGNRVLLVSKPHVECITRICDEFSEYKAQILFRFTITARSDELIEFWEPGAPSYRERKSCLEYAYEQRFSTSVSVEPILDSNDVVAMVRELLPLVTHSIWLGKMNRIEKRVNQDSREATRRVMEVVLGQSDETILAIYQQLKDEPLVRWKESIKEIIGIDLPVQAGIDQ